MTLSTLLLVLAGLLAFVAGTVIPVVAFGVGFRQGRASVPKGKAVLKEKVAARRRTVKPRAVKPRRAEPEHVNRSTSKSWRDDPVFLHLQGMGFRIREIESVWTKVEGTNVGDRLGSALKVLGAR